MIKEKGIKYTFKGLSEGTQNVGKTTILDAKEGRCFLIYWTFIKDTKFIKLISFVVKNVAQLMKIHLLGFLHVVAL